MRKNVNQLIKWTGVKWNYSKLQRSKRYQRKTRQKRRNSITTSGWESVGLASSFKHLSSHQLRLLCVCTLDATCKLSRNDKGLHFILRVVGKSEFTPKSRCFRLRKYTASNEKWRTLNIKERLSQNPMEYMLPAVFFFLENSANNYYLRKGNEEEKKNNSIGQLLRNKKSWVSGMEWICFASLTGTEPFTY